MSRLGPLYAALAIFPLLAAGAALPYVAHEYRRRGTLGAGHLALGAVFGLYLVGLAFAVILPLRPVTADFCSIFGVQAEYDPLTIVDSVREARAGGGLRGVLRSPDVHEPFLNVLLFIPLGMLVRHMVGRGFAVTVAIGFAVSLLIELTQLTGNWGLYPCAYRFFATLDLVTNTTGAAIGALLAPLLRLVPAQPTLARPDQPQPVTANRRLLAAACNAAAILALGFVLLAASGLLLDATRGQLFESDAVLARALRVVTLVLAPGALVMLVVPLRWRGQTPGEWAVLLRPARIGAGAPDPIPLAIVLRFLAGPAPMLALAAAGVAGVETAWMGLVVAALAHVVLVRRGRPWRGGVALRLGMQITDSR